MPGSTKIERVNSRPTVEIHLPDGEVLRGPRGARVGEFLAALNGGPPSSTSYSNGTPLVTADRRRGGQRSVA